MNIVYTAVPRILRSISVPPRIPVFINTRSFATRSNPKKEEEVEDVLYKRCELECRSVDPAVLKSYSVFTQKAAKELGITVGDVITPLKPNKKRFTMLKSVFIYAKHLVQYEIRTYYTTIKFLHLTGSTADTFLEYVERNLPEGVAMKVTKVRLERLPEHLKTPPDMSSPADEDVDQGITEEARHPSEKKV